MLPRIEESKKAKKEINFFKKEVNKIQNEDAKLKGIKLLGKLKEQTNIIYNNHTSLISKNIDAKHVRENIERLVSIRKELLKLIKDANS